MYYNMPVGRCNKIETFPWQRDDIIQRAQTLGVEPRELWQMIQSDPLTREREEDSGELPTGHLPIDIEQLVESGEAIEQRAGRRDAKRLRIAVLKERQQMPGSKSWKLTP